MTLPLRRKRRTTVRSITPGTRAVKAALLFALMAAPALAQPPGAAPKPLPGANLVPGPGTGGAAAAPNNTLPNGLALPPGYRPRTPPPQAQPAPPARPPAPTASTAAPGSSGTMMYFQKPADALTATGGGLPSASDGVAQLGGREPVAPRPAPDAAPTRPALPPVTTAPFVPPPAMAEVAVQPEVPVQPQPRPMQKGQPGDMTSTSQKQDIPVKDVDPKEIQLPARDKIFGVAYNDADLERAIMDAARADLKRLKTYTPALEKDLVFPTLPVVTPPGVVYQPKTQNYPQNRILLEPGYVVHRRLHFEQRNFERAGWDLGPLTTLVSAGKFYRDVLLWPAGLVSGCTYGFWDTSAGKCLPGSPTPLYLYPPNLTCGGIMAEAGLITGFAFLFP